MMRHRTLLVLLILALLVNSCGGPGTNVLRVTSTLPSGVVGRDLIVPVTFSQRIVPQDSVNQWTSTPYITFSPEIPGKFIWEDSTRLVFSPDGQRLLAMFGRQPTICAAADGARRVAHAARHAMKRRCNTGSP